MDYFLHANHLLEQGELSLKYAANKVTTYEFDGQFIDRSSSILLSLVKWKSEITYMNVKEILLQ